MRLLSSLLAMALCGLQSQALFAQRIPSGPGQRSDTLERCRSAEEPGCDGGFVKVVWPKPIPGTCGRPAFLPQLLPSGYSGYTTVLLTVDASGGLLNSRVLHTSGISALDDALMSAAATCRFEPGSRGGNPAVLTSLWFEQWGKSDILSTAVRIAPLPSRIPPPAPPSLTTLNCPKLQYPNAAIRAEAQGVTAVRLKVDETGKVTYAEVVGSSGESREHKLLDHVAADTLAKCQFNALVGAGERSTVLKATWALNYDQAPSPAASVPN